MSGVDRLAREIAGLRRDVRQLELAPPQLPHSTIDVAGEPVLLPEAVGSATASAAAANAAVQESRQELESFREAMTGEGGTIAQVTADVQAASAAAAAAQSTADSAGASASSAYSAAQAASSEAAAAAGLAESKADVRIQSTAPTGSLEHETTLWIDTTGGANTPKRWDGSGWVAVTDKAAVDAAAAAAAAQSAADAAGVEAAQAKAAADAAASTLLGHRAELDAMLGQISTLDGKVTITTRAPTVSDGAGKPVNAVWEHRSGGVAAARWVWTGTAWQSFKAGQDFIGANSIGAAQIIDASIGTAEIADLAVTNAKIGDLSVDKLRVTTGAEIPRAVITYLWGKIADYETIIAQQVIVTDEDGTVKVRITGEPGDALQVVDEDEAVAASLSPTGAVSGREGVFDTLRVGGRDIAEVVARESTSRVVGRGSVLTDVRPIVSEYGLIEVGYQERPGHLYRLDWSASWSARVAGDRAQFRFRRSAVDGAVTITSEELVNSRAVTIAERADLSRTDVGVSLFEGTQEGWRRILMTIARRSGSGQIDMNSRTVVDFPPVYMIITEVGENVPDTGRANSGGGVLYNTPAPPAPPSAKTAFDRTFVATGFNSYSQSGGTPSNPGLTNPIQGRSPFYTASGSQYSKIHFDHAAIQAQLAGAESVRAWAYLHMQHWHSSAGGWARLQLLNSNGSLGHWGDVRFTARGQGVEVELTSGQALAFASGGWVGLGLSGMGSISTDHYGYATWTDQVRPQLRFTGLK